MKKNIITGVLAIGLIASGGTGLYLASAKEAPESPMANMEEHGMDADEMTDMMGSSNVKDMMESMEEQKMNFGQMKPHMKEMHPDLNDQELQQLYKEMHGSGGAMKSKAGQGMSGNL